MEIQEWGYMQIPCSGQKSAGLKYRDFLMASSTTRPQTVEAFLFKIFLRRDSQNFS